MEGEVHPAAIASSRTKIGCREWLRPRNYRSCGGSDEQSWITWASEYADYIDPITVTMAKLASTARKDE